MSNIKVPISDAENRGILKEDNMQPIPPQPTQPQASPRVVFGNGVVSLPGYASGSPKDIGFGATDYGQVAGQIVQSGELYRIQRGHPYQRAGRHAPIFPAFKSQNITLPNFASQPQANSSAKVIVTPTADPNTTNNTSGSPYVGWPGFNKINIT